MSKWANRSLPVTARLRSRFFINIGGPQGHATPLKNMSKWANRSLPVTARLRSRFFINIGGPQGHATPLKNMSRGGRRPMGTPFRSRLGRERLVTRF
ncbi:MAG: hypothetical protein ABSH09_36395 [Bryobacteraceae bacterium]